MADLELFIFSMILANSYPLPNIPKRGRDIFNFRNDSAPLLRWFMPCDRPLSDRATRARSYRWKIVAFHVRIYQTADHALILSVMFCRFRLEELNTLLAQRKRYLDALFTESQLLRRGKKITDNLYVAKWLIRVFDFCFSLTSACACIGLR